MTLYQRLHMLHRVARYRWRTERAELRFVLQRKFHGGSVLDIGAHRGVYSYWLHGRFKDVEHVVAFEPQPELACELRDLKQAFRLDRLIVEEVGLSSRRGNLQMCRPRSHWGGATVECVGDISDADYFDVPITSMDEYLSAHPELRPVRFIKCDVEAHEADVLEGAVQTLNVDRPELLVEWTTTCTPRRQRLFELMSQLDYRILQFESGRLQPCTTAVRDRAPSWELGANYVLLPAEVATAAS